jgi:ABC-2 type transport system ATP-binding protein
MGHSISVTDLVVRYKSSRGACVEAVSGLSFSVREGEIVGFLGPNGAGKSSTLKALMGFVPVSKGECSVCGCAAGSVSARRLTGYLPEVAMYYPYLSPFETMTLYGELQGLGGASLKREAAEILERLGLGKWMRTPNRKLSKGMLQRVGIAQSMLGDPKLLILDEVTSGLDPLGRQDLRELLRSRQKQGATLFFSSHELNEVENLCDRILIIDKGRLIDERELGPLQEELRQFAIVFKSKVDLRDISQSVEPRGDVQVASFGSRELLLEAVQRVHAARGEILDLISREGSLESYFIETLRRAA